MIIKECRGQELCKSKSNSPEEFFNLSEVEYVTDGKHKTFQVTYLRYFDEKMEELVPYPMEPLFEAGGKDIFFMDIVGLVCLLKNKDNEKRKRIYISDYEEFSGYFAGFDRERIEMILKHPGNKEMAIKQ